MNFQALQIHFRIHADLLTQKNYATRHLLSCSHTSINGHCHCSLHSSNTGMVWFQLRGRAWAVEPYLASRFKHTKGDLKSWSGFIRIRIMCCVRFSGFKDGENARQLPNCKHFFSFSLYWQEASLSLRLPPLSCAGDRVDYPATDPDNFARY